MEKEIIGLKPGSHQYKSFRASILRFIQGKERKRRYL